MNLETRQKPLLLGIFLICLATLMYELVMTRIFSVVIWYYFAYAVISVALLGMGAAGTFVFLLKHYRGGLDHTVILPRASFLMGLFVFISALITIYVPFDVNRIETIYWSLAGIFVTLVIPFFFAGVVVAVVLSSYTKIVSRLYFADLVGAGFGCFLTLVVLNLVSGFDAVLIISLICLVGGSTFYYAFSGRFLRNAYVSLFIIIAGLLLVNQLTRIQGLPLIKYDFTKGFREDTKIYEKWNSFSRVIVFEDRNPDWPEGWGVIRKWKGEPPTELIINMDAEAATPLTQFDGDISKHDYLAYDVSSVAYNLRPYPEVCIIGGGGGRDILTAKYFDAKRVVAIEVNPMIVGLAREQYADFTGNIYDQPEVEAVVDEARTYLSRIDDEFDLIQISLIDTWAATSAGAFVLTENALYTREAFREFYRHLKDDGILSVSRWFNRDAPSESIRLVLLALQAWKDEGIEWPSPNVMVAASVHPEVNGVATLMIKKTPFTDEEIREMEKYCQIYGMKMVMPSDNERFAEFQKLRQKIGYQSYGEHYPVDITPPTDDRPFFFNMLRLGDFLNLTGRFSARNPNNKAIFVIVNVAIIASIAALVLIMVPLIASEGRKLLQYKWPYHFYFAFLGLGYMAIEIPLIQRCVLLLGSPVYALAVVLFSLLVSSGLGSLTTDLVSEKKAKAFLNIILLILVPMIGIYIWWLPGFITNFIHMPTPARILVAIAFIAPLGYLMGMAFPLGIKISNLKVPGIVPWAWAVNGAMSVVASVTALILAVGLGYSAVMWLGGGAYAFALLLALVL